MKQLSVTKKPPTTFDKFNNTQQRKSLFY